MRVLTIYAHHNPHSFCHALLERFDAGVRDAGHTNEVVARMVATMAVGGDAFADKLNAFSMVMNDGHRLANWFVAQYGSSQCRVLTGCDFSTVEGVEGYVSSSCLARCHAIAEGVAARVAKLSTRSIRQLPVLAS